MNDGMVSLALLFESFPFFARKCDTIIPFDLLNISRARYHGGSKSYSLVE